MRIIPPGVSFLRALNSGMLGRIEDADYRRWVKSLPCCAPLCGKPADDPHHPYGVGILKGGGTKLPDYLCIPLCRPCHDALHADPAGWERDNGPQLQHAAMTMLQAMCSGCR